METIDTRHSVRPATVDEPPLINTTSVYQVGYKCDQNSKYRKTMEDKHVNIDNFGGVPTRGFFAIYDGHAGTVVAEYLSNYLHVVCIL